jgi:signal peptidase
MSPTIQEGDGFVVVPDQLTGDIDEGDVVVFQSQEIEGGELTTHRIVGETDRGYITKGDGNPFTDQDGVEPPVTESQIVATAWQPGGRIVRIPSLGTAILGTRAFVFEVQASVAAAVGVEGADNAQEVGGALFLSGLVLLVLTTVNQFRRGTSRDRSRTRGQDTVDPRYAVIFLIAIVVVPANLAMVSPSTTHEISTAEIAQGSGVGPGGTAEAKLSARNGGAVTMLVVFEPPEDVTLNSRQLEVVGGGTASTTMFVPVPSSDCPKTDIS